MRPWLPLLCCLIFTLAPAQAGPDDDVLAEALAAMGLTRADLGYAPKGYWNRYPDPVTTPFKLRAFDDLHAEPLRIYDYTRTIANTVGRFADPAYAREGFETPDTRLYHLAATIGVDRFMGGFRTYSANLDPHPDSVAPIQEALRDLHAYAGRDLESRTFDAVTPWIAEGSPEAAMLASVPLSLQTIVAAGLLNWLDAIRWRDLALRRCDGEDLAAVFAIRDLGLTQGDGQVFYPAIEDVARDLDWQSLGYSWLKAASAAGVLRMDASAWALEHPEEAGDLHLDLPTPYGRVVIDGTDDIQLSGEPIGFYLDLGGSDTLATPVGATASLQMPVAIAVDLGGADTYDAGSLNAGAGILGVGVLWDAGVGDNTFRGERLLCGAGQLGCGLLFVEGDNDDTYEADSSAQGAAFLGVGLLVDQQGDDHYTLRGGEGQGFGSLGGVGVLGDYAGDDSYYAEPDAAKAAGRADYHSDFAVNVSNAQGCGSGRRGDGSDGHAWAGGLGVLADLTGDDRYTAGNFSQGIGYWFGIGSLWDGAGDDVYDSVYFTQGSGAHFCIGALIDEGEGDDAHLLSGNAGAALGFGWDFTNALFLDAGGNDRYRAKLISIGMSAIRSNAFFLELGGNDRYEFAPLFEGFGASDWQENYDTPAPLSPYMAYARSVGVFLDAGGVDEYLAIDNAAHELPMANDATWRQKEGIGVDREGGVLWEREFWNLTPGPI